MNLVSNAPIQVDRVSLMQACLMGNITEISRNLGESSEMASKDCDGFGHTPIFYAIMGGSSQAVSYLISKGARVNVQNRMGNCALHYAIVLNHEWIVTLLLQAGADPNARTVEGDSALELALIFATTGTVKALLDAGGLFELAFLRGVIEAAPKWKSKEKSYTEHIIEPAKMRRKMFSR